MPSRFGKGSKAIYNGCMPSKQNAAKQKSAKNKKYGKGVTVLLILNLFVIFALAWAVFISGPARLHEAKQKEVEQAIESQVSGISDLSETIFEYETWQGHDASTLYWFDQTGALITTRELSTLDYNRAREKFVSLYGVDCDTVELGFGYSSPVYRLSRDDVLLLLDYDTLEKVYERGVLSNGQTD